MADNLSSTCEGTSGTTISPSNSAGPDQFDTVALGGTGCTSAWDNAQAHAGSTSWKIGLPASVASMAYADWTTSISPTPVANAYIRFYLYLTANPTVNTRLAGLNGAAVAQCSLQVSTTGTLRLVAEGGANIYTTTASVPLSAWCRIEVDCTSNTGTTNSIAVRLFSGANLEGTTPDSGGTASATAQTCTAQVNDARFGVTTTTETAAWSAWYDDIAFSDTATPGPSGGTGPSAGADTASGADAQVSTGVGPPLTARAWVYS